MAGFRIPLICQSALCTALLATGLPARADIRADAFALVKKGDNAGAIKLLEPAAEKGDIAAKGRLALYLAGMPQPYLDLPRACRLAHEATGAADAPDAADVAITINSDGLMVRALCLMRKAEPSEHPFEEARRFAQLAFASDPGAGIVLYLIFTADPKYSYITNGKTDKEKYDALAAMPVSARGDQIEALTGLSWAQTMGVAPAHLSCLAYLIQTTAPKNAEKTVYLADMLSKRGIKIPDALAGYIKAAAMSTQFGGSHASAKLFIDTYQSAYLAASSQIVSHAGGAAACDAKSISLTGIKADQVQDAEYLPLNPDSFLHDTYLVHGRWNETWTFSGCGKTGLAVLDFTADGWGGALFHVKAGPPN